MPYELYKGKKSNIYHLYAFRCKCFVLRNEKDNLTKFKAKANGVYFKDIPLLVKILEFSIKEP